MGATKNLKLVTSPNTTDKKPVSKQATANKNDYDHLDYLKQELLDIFSKLSKRGRYRVLVAAYDELEKNYQCSK